MSFWQLYWSLEVKQKEKRVKQRREREKWNKKEMIRGREDRRGEGRNCVLFLPTFLCSLFCFVASCYVSLSLGRPLLHNFVHLRWWWDVCCSRSCRSFSWLFFYFSLSLSLVFCSFTSFDLKICSSKRESHRSWRQIELHLLEWLISHCFFVVVVVVDAVPSSFLVIEEDSFVLFFPLPSHLFYSIPASSLNLILVFMSWHFLLLWFLSRRSLLSLFILKLLGI